MSPAHPIPAGGYNDPDGIKNNLAFLELKGSWERSGAATRFRTTREDHAKLVASHGPNAFRMGLEWTRVQPSASLEPHAPLPWDHRAVDQYAEMVAALFEYELQPIITLHQFTCPAWAASDLWIGAEGSTMLVDFELKVVEGINERLLRSGHSGMRHFLVYNEPNVILGLAVPQGRGADRGLPVRVTGR